MTHTFNTNSQTSCHRNRVVHAFNPSPREEYKTGGNSSHTQSHSEIPGDRITISDWGQGKSQRLTALPFRSSGLTPISDPEFLLILLHLVPNFLWHKFMKKPFSWGILATNPGYSWGWNSSSRNQNPNIATGIPEKETNAPSSHLP